jgi:TetR/AcrR family transcriptional regulator, cholesterol catabolism regulator
MAQVRCRLSPRERAAAQDLFPAPGRVEQPALDAAALLATDFPSPFRRGKHEATMSEETTKTRARVAGMAEPETRRLSAGPRRRAEEVLEAAASVFAERGFHGASTQDIADRLGMRQASLYYYFISKEAALEQVCQRGIEHITGDAEIIAASPGSAVERLAGIMRRHIEPLGEDCASLRAYLYEVRFLPKESKRRIGKLAHLYERIIESLLEQGIAAGDIRGDIDIPIARDAILGMCNHAAHWPGKEPSGTMKHVAEELIRLVLHGIATDRHNMMAG